MKSLTIKGNKSDSKLLVGESIQNLRLYLPENRVVVITDSNVNRLYGRNFNQYPVIEIGTGEKIKTLGTVAAIYEEMLAMEVDRSWFVLGIGGGVVCDIAGFAASTFMRGLKFGFVSTTLLSQVDASVGGKNGVNLDSFKNIIGTFNQPQFVICDPELLKTLPQREILSGLGEVVKHALIADQELFSYLEVKVPDALDLKGEVLEYLVYTSAVIKSGTVNSDETEKGERRKLNFGHTVGHAIEKCTSIYTHGEAVAIGMVAAAALSKQQGRISDPELVRIVNLLKNLGLPVTTDISRDELIRAMRHDKKREASYIDLVLLNAIGKCEVVRTPIEESADLVNALLIIPQ
jgi:3-dehydroquinate synthase